MFDLTVVSDYMVQSTTSAESFLHRLLTSEHLLSQVVSNIVSCNSHKNPYGRVQFNVTCSTCSENATLFISLPQFECLLSADTVVPSPVNKHYVFL